MESITREKKKLRTIVRIFEMTMAHRRLMQEREKQFSFEAKAPSGYTFIPAGNPHLTTACKERCRKEGLEVHAVSVRHTGTASETYDVTQIFIGYVLIDADTLL